MDRDVLLSLIGSIPIPDRQSRGTCHATTGGQRRADNDIVASVGSKGDSYDNAITNSFNRLYQWELIYLNGLWRVLGGPNSAELAAP